jgi:hypothetical protein
MGYDGGFEMSGDIKITIITNPKFRPLRAVLNLVTQIGVIGVGVWAESAAMQWAGFAALILVLIGAMVVMHGESAGLTIPEARTALDRIESREARK